MLEWVESPKTEIPEIVAVIDLRICWEPYIFTLVWLFVGLTSGGFVVCFFRKLNTILRPHHGPDS
jgi:hypothetical protein